MKHKVYTTNMHEENPSDYIINCVRHGVVSADRVLNELIHHLSLDDVKDVIYALDLKDTYEHESV